MPASPACKPAAALAVPFSWGWRTTRDAWTGIATRVGFTSGFHHASRPKNPSSEYPSDFPIKVMGKASRAGPDADRAGAAVSTGPLTPPPSRCGPARSGSNYMGLTFTVRATSREQLDALYRALHGHPMVSIVI